MSTISNPSPDISLVDHSSATPDFDRNSSVVYSNILNVDESECLINDISSLMKRRRYEKGHWDAVITSFKEIELHCSTLSNRSSSVLTRIQSMLEANHLTTTTSSQQQQTKNDHDDPKSRWLPCHAIDLHPSGELNAHVDSVRYSGGLVAGLSLLSDSIMRLRPAPESEVVMEGENDDDDDDGYRRHQGDINGGENGGYVDLYLPQRSLYVLTGMSRYKYTHEILPDGSKFVSSSSSSTDDGVQVSRGHRLSVIFRDVK